MKIKMRILTVTAVFALSFALPSFVSAADAPLLLGDVNRDGVVDIADASKIQMHAASLSVLTGDALRAADANGDNKVDVADATAVQRYAAGIETAYAIGKAIDAEETTAPATQKPTRDPYELPFVPNV